MRGTSVHAHVCAHKQETERAGQCGFLVWPCLLASHLMFNRRLEGKRRASCFTQWSTDHGAPGSWEEGLIAQHERPSGPCFWDTGVE